MYHPSVLDTKLFTNADKYLIESVIGIDTIGVRVLLQKGQFWHLDKHPTQQEFRHASQNSKYFFDSIQMQHSFTFMIKSKILPNDSESPDQRYLKVGIGVSDACVSNCDFGGIESYGVFLTYTF